MNATDPPTGEAVAASPETRAELRRRFLGLAIPNVLANVAVPLAGVVDTALLGHLPGMAQLAGVALTTIVFDYVYWTFGFLRMGTTSLAAQSLGAGHEREADRWLARAVFVGLAIGFAILALQWPIGWGSFAILEGTPQVETAGRAYFNARIWGAPFALSVFALTGWLLAQQRGRAVLAVTVAGALSNIGLDLLFINRFGWGAAGAGGATALSQGVMFVMAIWLVGLGRVWGLVRDRDWWGRPAFGRLFSLGGDLMVRTFALLTAFGLFTNFSAGLGTVVLASNAVLLKALSVAAWVIDGYAFALEALAGLAKGRGGRSDLRAVLAMSMRWGVGTGLVFAAVFLAFPQSLGVMTNQTAVLAPAIEARVWLLPTLAFSSIAYIFDGFFIGLAAGRTLRVTMVGSLLVGFVPLATYARYGSGDPQHLWWAMVTFMVARVISLGFAVPAALRDG